MRRHLPQSCPRIHPDYLENMAFAWLPSVSGDLVSGAEPTLLNAGIYGTGHGNGGQRQLTCTSNGFTPNGCTFSGTIPLHGGIGEPGVTILIVLNYWANVGGNSDNNLVNAGGGGIGITSGGAIKFFRAGVNFTSTATLTAMRPAVIAVTQKYLGESNIWINQIKEVNADDGRAIGTTGVVGFGGNAGNSSIGVGVAAAFAWNAILPDSVLAPLVAHTGYCNVFDNFAANDEIYGLPLGAAGGGGRMLLLGAG